MSGGNPCSSGMFSESLQDLIDTYLGGGLVGLLTGTYVYNYTHSEHLGQFYEKSLGCMPMDYFRKQQHPPLQRKQQHDNAKQSSTYMFLITQYEADKYSLHCKEKRLYCFNNLKSIKHHSLFF